MNTGIFRRTAVCLALITLASCAPQLPQEQPAPAATQPVHTATATVQPTIQPTATAQPMPTLPADFDPAAFLNADALEVERVSDEEMTVRTGEKVRWSSFIP